MITREEEAEARFVAAEEQPRRIVPLAFLRRVAALLEDIEISGEHRCPACCVTCEYAEDNEPIPSHAPDCELAALRADLAEMLEGK